LEAPSHYAALRPHSGEGSTVCGTMTIGGPYGKGGPSSHILKYYKDLTVEGNLAINPQHLHDFTFIITTSANLGMLSSAELVDIVTSDGGQGNGILKSFLFLFPFMLQSWIYLSH